LAQLTGESSECVFPKEKMENEFASTMAWCTVCAQPYREGARDCMRCTLLFAHGIIEEQCYASLCLAISFSQTAVRRSFVCLEDVGSIAVCLENNRMNNAKVCWRRRRRPAIKRGKCSDTSEENALIRLQDGFTRLEEIMVLWCYAVILPGGK